ncbi:hypothetical protein [Methylobacterium fujisawaense]|uniref:hypothetical protein n=1 Tax=Methylobacterium fujisawaense TaxID=107400 RepID=UPI00313F3B6B
MKDSELYAHRTDLNDAAMEKAEQRVKGRIENTLQMIERDIGLSHIDPSDAQRLRHASQQIKEGARHVLPLIESLRSEEHHQYRSFLRGIDELTAGLVEAATRLAATPSGKNFFGGIKDHEKGRDLRDAKDKRNSARSEAIDQAIIASAQAQRVGGKWPSEWKLAEAIRVDVRRRLKGTGYRIGPTSVYDRLRQLFENNALSRSALIEPIREPRQTGGSR